MKTNFRRSVLALLILAIANLVMVYAQQPKKDNMAHDQMNKRGDHVMGFDHTKTTHQFLLQESAAPLR